MSFLLHSDDCVLRFGLNHLHEVGDFPGGLRRAFGQFSDLVGDDGKPGSGFTCAGRLDGRVQREQVGLVGDIANRRHDVRNF